MRAASGPGARKSRLVFSAYLSGAQVREYIPFLEGRQFLRRDPSTNLFRLTDKGKQALDLYEKMAEVFRDNAGIGFTSGVEGIGTSRRTD